MPLRTSPTEARAYDHVMEFIRQKEAANLGHVACGPEAQIDEIDFPTFTPEDEAEPWPGPAAEAD